jgi:hypothetical protein
MYLIWSFEHDSWWKPCRHGYTEDVMQAGLYSKEDAEQICEHANSYEEINEEMRPAKDYGRVGEV